MLDEIFDIEPNLGVKLIKFLTIRFELGGVEDQISSFVHRRVDVMAEAVTGTVVVLSFEKRIRVEDVVSPELVGSFPQSCVGLRFLV